MSEPLSEAELACLERRLGSDWTYGPGAEVQRLIDEVRQLQAELASLAESSHNEWMDVRRRKSEADLRWDSARREADRLQAELAEARSVAATILHYTNSFTRGQLEDVIDANPWLGTAPIIEQEP